MSIRMVLLDSWTPELAWWLGALYGDGNVYRGKADYRISLVGSLSTTRRWLALIRPGAVPREFKHSVGTYQAYVNSKVLFEWFERRGVSGPKAHSLAWPNDLPQEHKVHFLRGLWDTDGSLSIHPRKPHKGNPEVKARFSTSTESFIVRVREELRVQLGVGHVAVCPPDRGVYVISYSGSAAMEIADALYRDVPEHLRNEDRYQVYLRMVALRDQIQDMTCPCGRPATHEGRCQRCWWELHGRKTGAGTVCSCGKPILARGLCSACYTRQRRRGLTGAQDRDSVST